MFFGLTQTDLDDEDEEFGVRIAMKLSPVWPLLARRYPGLKVVSVGKLNIGVEGVSEDLLPSLNEDFTLAYKLAAVDIISDDANSSSHPLSATNR